MALSLSKRTLVLAAAVMLVNAVAAGYYTKAMTTTESEAVEAPEPMKKCGFYPMTAPAIRALFKPEDFVFDLDEAKQVNNPGALLQFGNQDSFPVLAVPDTDMTLARVRLDEGASNPTHVHPRGTEMLYLIKGTLKVFISKEAGNGMIKNVIYAGKGTVFPKGIPHGQKCVHGPCEFVAVLNAGDPGSVSPVTVG